MGLAHRGLRGEKRASVSARILMLNYEFPPVGGGSATATRYLLQEFTRVPELTVDLITSAPGEHRETHSLSSSIRVFKLPVGIGTPTYYAP